MGASLLALAKSIYYQLEKDFTSHSVYSNSQFHIATF